MPFTIPVDSSDDKPKKTGFTVPVAGKEEGALSDSLKTAASLPERIGGGIAMGLPNLVNQAVAGPQYLGRGIAEGVDKVIGVDPQPRGDIWQPAYSSEDVLQKLPEPLRPHTPTTAAGQTVDTLGNLASQVILGKPKESLAVAKSAISNAKPVLSKLGAVTKPFLQDESSGGKLGYPIAHPVEAATRVVKSATKLGNQAIKPLANKLLDKKLTPELQSTTAQEGERLGKKFGIQFSAGELTGNKTVMGMEDALANKTSTTDKFALANQKKTDAIISGYKKTLNEIYPKSVSRTGVGEKISSAYKSTIDKLITARRSQASSDAEAAGLATGGKPIIEPTNFINTLKKFVADSKSPTATPAQESAGKEAEQMIRNLSQKQEKPSTILDAQGLPIERPATSAYKKITVKDLQNGLQAYGDGAYAGKGIWRKLDTASDRRFSADAKAALEADLDAAAEGGDGQSAQALKKFRNNYRNNSAKISDIEKQTLGKIVGGADHDSEGNLVVSPEKIADKFSAMDPTELKNALSFLDKTHPDVAQMARRYTLEKALTEAVEGRGQRGTGTTKPFAKAEFVTKIPSDEKLNALFKDPKAANDVRDVAAAMNRLIDYGASRRGPQTAQRLDTLSEVNWKLGAIYKSLLSDSLADDLLNPQLRKTLVANAKQINNTKPSPQPTVRPIGPSLGQGFKDFMNTQIK